MPPTNNPMSASPVPDTAAPSVNNPSSGANGQPPNLEAIRKSLNPIAIVGDDLANWWSRIEASKSRREKRENEWDILMGEYEAEVSEEADAGDVKCNAHFRNIQTKTGQLFVKSPKIILTAKGIAKDTIPIPGPMGMPIPAKPETAVPLRQAVINEMMGPEFIDGVALMDECLLDMQGYSGMAPVKIGYVSVSRPLTRPKMQPDPTFVPPPPAPGSLGLMPTPAPQVPMLDPVSGQPMTETIQVPCYEEWFATKFSSKKLLLDEQLRSPRIEKHSRWIGMEFFMNARVAKRKFGLTDEEVSAATVQVDDRIYEGKDDAATDSGLKDLIHGYELYYYAMYFTDRDHPQAVYQLILLDNLKSRTAVSRPSVDQTFDDRDQLTYDSLEGFPILVGRLRDMIDTPFTQADSAFTNAHAKQLDVWDQQSVMLRDAAIGQYFYDTEAIDPDDNDKMKRGHVGERVGLKGGALAQGADKIFYTTAQVRQTADDPRNRAAIKAEMNETLGISANQAGASNEHVLSATEIATTQSNATGRNKKEQANCINFYLRITRGIDTLVFRYATGDRYVKMVGKDGAQTLAKWNRMLGAGCYSYDIQVDSQLDNDVARDRQQGLALYNSVAKDPLVNRRPVLRDLFVHFGKDPGEYLLSDQQVMQAQTDAAAGAPTQQPPHGGPANKHQIEQSGRGPNAPQQGGGADNRDERKGQQTAAPAQSPAQRLM